MNERYTLFEISWEVCNKVGGIHSVVSMKAETALSTFGDDYVTIGPWKHSEERDPPFDAEPGHEAFVAACRDADVPVRIGRWRIPGRPLVILVDFSRLYDSRDDLFADLWEDFSVDSLTGGWDYSEPVLFGWAAGIVVEKWWDEYLSPRRRRCVVHAHEWMTGTALLYLKPRLPSAGTVFTTHGTVLGRTLSSLGMSPSVNLDERTPDELAQEHDVVAKHSLEGVVAREADVFTTISPLTADEADRLHGRRPEPLLPNGIDLDVVDALVGETERAVIRDRLRNVASRFVGRDLLDATLVCVSGRDEFHNKGVDLLLDALAKLDARDGAPIVLFVLVPAGNSGVRSEVLERLASPGDDDGPLGLSTHHLFDEDNDAFHRHCASLGLDNGPDRRVCVVRVPAYLDGHDGVISVGYESTVRAMDVTCYPSYYEPWGYTAQESLALGVPTITTDYAGFGRWAAAEGLDADDGIVVIRRVDQEYAAVVDALAAALESRLGETDDALRETCRKTAERATWRDLYPNYTAAYDLAITAVGERSRSGVQQRRRPRRPLTTHAVDNRSTPRLTRFDVTSRLPAELGGLSRLARNFWWCWNPEATALFADLSPDAWQASGQNPITFLSSVAVADLEERARDADYVERVRHVLARFDRYVDGTGKRWPIDANRTLERTCPVAYLSAEFGIHDSLPIYSGGLGVLAGDHLKSASDLDLPLVAVGLFYRFGYMSQRLTSAGEQVAVDLENDPIELALDACRDGDGRPLEINLPLPGRDLRLRAWAARIGRVTLYLLDANVAGNSDEDRDITRNLYGGDDETRILQEIVLGRGSVRLLRALGIEPAVWHMNEGHAAFSSLERVARLVGDEGLSFDAAREFVGGTTVFTTHTPVPAGHDRFHEDLVRRHFSDADEWVGLPWEKFFALGQPRDGSEPEMFNMTHLAMSFAAVVNGVSQLHRVASAKLLRAFWPGLLEAEVPIVGITNGVHLPTWTHGAMANALGLESARGSAFAEAAERATFADLWQARQTMRRELNAQLRESLQKSFLQRSDSPILLGKILEGLDTDALWVCFARRFAPYKRAHLLFQDLDRLRALLDDPERPLRILVSGKAHPRDTHGQDILKSIAELARNGDLLGKVVFVEDYDMGVARGLVSGVDVWLNNPTRMQEASGTSGMKAAANGVLNLSIADGWWAEAANGENGWTIAGPRVYADQDLQNEFDAAALYRLLEEEVLPLYFDRDADGVPVEWLRRVKNSLVTVPPVFDTDRMVGEYTELAYLPLAAAWHDLGDDRKTGAKNRARDVQRVRRGFDDVKIVKAEIPDLDRFAVGDEIDARLEVDLGSLSTEDVTAELVVGHVRGDDEPAEPAIITLEPTGTATNGTATFAGSCRLERSGHYAHGLRVRARARGTLTDLVRWA